MTCYDSFTACGEDVVIAPDVIIKLLHLASVGNHVAIDAGFYCTAVLEIDDYVHIGPHVVVTGGSDGILRMGNFTNLAAGCRVVCVSDEFLGEGLIGIPAVIPDKYRDKSKIAPVVIEDFANVGTGVTILPGVTLRRGSVVGACSLVTKSTEPWMIYYGVPAKPVRPRRKEKMLRFALEMGYI